MFSKSSHLVSLSAAAMFCLLVIACASPTRLTSATPTAEPQSLGQMRVERVFSQLGFRRLTNLVQPGDGRGRLYITEQPGRIWWFPSNPDASGATLFLDITDRVSQSNNEEGLLGVAFPSDYATSGQFYLYYSAAAPRRSVLSRFSVSRGNPDTADPSSELIIMEIPQPFGNHNGGQIAFGPDGYLYMGLGDGGSQGDPQGNGQNIGTLLGSILRIDVGTEPNGKNYRIPPDNPFVETAQAREEIWAYGLRNPWRFSFDRETGALWAGDVGQNEWEEIDLIRKGSNYGWNVMEGRHCFSPPQGCVPPRGSMLPTFEYNHEKGCSVTGGYVYRGSRLPALQGVYVYADFCSGKIWGLRYDDGVTADNALLAESGLSITAFGEDVEGRLYILSRDQGIYRFAK